MPGLICNHMFLLPDVKSSATHVNPYDRRVVLVERRLREPPDERPLIKRPRALHRDKQVIKRLNLSKMWSMMHARCYDTSHMSYHQYGGAGVFVCDRWHNYRNFVEDIQHLPNFENKFDEPQKYHLDKDFYGSNCYSPQTCVWSTSFDHDLYTNRTIPIVMEMCDTRERRFFVNVDHA